TSWPRSVSSRTPIGVIATRYSSGLISVGMPTRITRHLLRFASGGVAVVEVSSHQLPCSQRQPQLDAVRGPGQIPTRELLDLANPVAQGVAVAVELARGPLPIAVVLDERLERPQQLAAVLALGPLDRVEQAVAVEAQRVVVL